MSATQPKQDFSARWQEIIALVGLWSRAVPQIAEPPTSQAIQCCLRECRSRTRANRTPPCMCHPDGNGGIQWEWRNTETRSVTRFTKTGERVSGIKVGLSWSVLFFVSHGDRKHGT